MMMKIMMSMIGMEIKNDRNTVIQMGQTMIETLLYAILIVVGLYMGIQIIQVVATLFVALVAMAFTVVVLVFFGIIEGVRLIINQLNEWR